MKKMLSIIVLLLVGVVGMGASETGCNAPPSSNDIQQVESEKLLKEATAQTGMPALVNFRERKLLKEILELRDQDGLTTYTYTFAENSGTLHFLCNSIGYGIPYATQYTSPEALQYIDIGGNTRIETLPQADPNGLFNPASADGTWVMCADPTKNGKVRPIYVEPKVIVSPFPLQ